MVGWGVRRLWGACSRVEYIVRGNGDCKQEALKSTLRRNTIMNMSLHCAYGDCLLPANKWAILVT